MQTALLVEPILQAGRHVRLLPAVHLRVAVVGLSAGHEVDGFDKWHTCRDVAAATAYLSVLAAQPLGTYADGACLLVGAGRIGTSLELGTHAVAVALVVVAHGDVGVPRRRTYGIARAQVAAGHQPQAADGPHLELGKEVLLVVEVTTVDALSAHQRQFVVQAVAQQVAIDHESHVASVVHAVQGVGSLACQIEHGLRIDVDELQLSGRQRVLHSVRVLELSQTYAQCLVACDAIVSVELLYDAREVVHEQERPSVGDSGLGPQQRALQVVGIGFPAVGVLVGPSALCVAVEGDARGEVLHPVVVSLRMDVCSCQHQCCRDDCCF